MELHLGLALSSSSSCSSRFDPNCNTDYTHESMISFHHSRKRIHGDDDHHTPQTMPILVWNNFCCNRNQLNEEHHDHDCDGDDEVQSNYVFVHQRKKLCHPKMENGDGGVLGWPPVKLCRKKLCHRKVGTGDNGGQSVGGRSKSMFVKVHMEGVGIARKVDLNLHQSYQTLVPTLANMFGKCFKDVKLTYQDKEGDWLLAGDVPWGSFINTIRRLRLLRKYR